MSVEEDGNVFRRGRCLPRGRRCFSKRMKTSGDGGEDVCRRWAGTSVRCTWSSKEHNTYMYFPNNKAKSPVIKTVKESKKKSVILCSLISRKSLEHPILLRGWSRADIPKKENIFAEIIDSRCNAFFYSCSSI